MNLIGLDKLAILKKDNLKFVLLYLLPTLVYGVVVFLFFFFSSRATKSMFPFFLAILSDLFITYILYLTLVPTSRFVKYKKLCKEVASKPLMETDVKVLSTSPNSYTIRGIRCVEVLMIDLENSKEMRRYLPIEYQDVFKNEQNYKITAFHELIARFEEISDEGIH